MISMVQEEKTLPEMCLTPTCMPCAPTAAQSIIKKSKRKGFMSTCCPCRRPEFASQHPHRVAQQLSGNWIWALCHQHCPDWGMQACLESLLPWQKRLQLSRGPLQSNDTSVMKITSPQRHATDQRKLQTCFCDLPVPLPNNTTLS